MYSTKLKLPINFEIWPTKSDSVWLAILSKQYFYAIRILHCIWNVRMLPKISWLLLLPFEISHLQQQQIVFITVLAMY